jgi:hypothetical protein
VLLLCGYDLDPTLLSAAGTNRHELPLTTQEFKYYLPEASQVTLIWWLEDGQVVAKEARPPGTERHNGSLYTPMSRNNDSFEVTLQVPIGALIRFVFKITKTHDGTPVEVWDTGAPGQRYYETVGIPKGAVRVMGTLKLLKEPVFLTQQIRFHLSEASQVLLVWWAQAWTVVPEELYPPGTVNKEGKYYTPMTREDEVFVAYLQVPVGTVVNYLFLITQARDGTALEVWDKDRHLSRHYQVIALPDSVANVRSEIRLGEGWPLSTQELRYHMPQASEVSLVWGIDGWATVPEELQPPGTIAKGSLLRTPMLRVADTFVTTLSLPVGVRLYYGFEISKVEGQRITPLWDADGGRDYRHIVSQDGVLAARSRLTPAALQEAAQGGIDGRAWFLVISAVVSLGLGLRYAMHAYRRRQRHLRRQRRYRRLASAASQEEAPTPLTEQLPRQSRGRRRSRRSMWTVLLTSFGSRRRRHTRRRRRASQFE